MEEVQVTGTSPAVSSGGPLGEAGTAKVGKQGAPGAKG